MDQCAADAYLGNDLKLKSRHEDVTAAFLCADPGEDEKVYVKMPLGFRKKGKVPRFKKLFTVYVRVPRYSGSG